jgi:hypothetical protein
MGDYGFRISQTGKDVKTCTDLECVFTSKYSLAKGSSYGTGNITDMASGDTAEGTLDITHNLGFIPVVRIFMLIEGEYIEIPETQWQAGVYIFDVFYEHVSVNKITIDALLWVNGGTPSIDLDFAYYISNEKVNI